MTRDCGCNTGDDRDCGCTHTGDDQRLQTQYRDGPETEDHSTGDDQRPFSNAQIYSSDYGGG
ncbi:unnamed protein product, partial [Staurois parvus]